MLCKPTPVIFLSPWSTVRSELVTHLGLPGVVGGDRAGRVQGWEKGGYVCCTRSLSLSAGGV